MTAVPLEPAQLPEPFGPACGPVEMVAITELIPYARNARTHDASQIAALKASMLEFGWTMPILRDERGMIIAGHARLQAAREMGWDKCPCLRAQGWTDAQKRAYVLADNRLTERGGWDWEM